MITRYAAAVLLTTLDGANVWLAKRSPDARIYPGQWECPAGKQDNETALDCAIRELHEEAGIYASSMRHEGEMRFIVGPDAQVQMGLFSHASQFAPMDTEPAKRGKWVLFPLLQASMLSNITPATALLIQHQMRNNHERFTR